MSYEKLKEKHQEEFNNFPMFFAFNQEQFDKGMISLGLKPTEKYKIYKFGDSGGFYRKEDSPALHEMFRRQRAEMVQAMESSDEFAYEMFNYELGNHEYIVTGSVEDTLASLGLTKEIVEKNPSLSKALQRACESQMERHEAYRLGKE